MRTPTLIGFAAAIVLGLTAGTGAALFIAHPGAESTMADTLTKRGAGTTRRDSTQRPAVPRAVAVSDTTSSHQAPKQRPIALSPLAALPTPPRAAVTSATNVADQARAQAAAREHLAKVFATMEPKGAALVLEQLSDGEIVQILAPIPERQTAAILEYFTPQRAAAVSRALLRTAKEGGTS